MDILARVNARTIEVTASRLVSTPCYVWIGSQSSGYGRIQAGRRSPAGYRMPSYVHALMYERLVGPVPTGKELDHICRVRACWRPEHLQPVSHATNVVRGVSIAADYAVRDECGRGHPKTPENRYYRPDGKGWTCLPCARLRATAQYRQANEAKRKADQQQQEAF